jgi:hypothetical protein
MLAKKVKESYPFFIKNSDKNLCKVKRLEIVSQNWDSGILIVFELMIQLP